MSKYIIFFYLLLTSCSYLSKIDSVRIEHGYGEPVLVGELLNKYGSGKPVDINVTKLSISKDIFDTSLFDFDTSLGVFTTTPIEHESKTGYGIFITPRLVYDQVIGLGRPFIGVDLGLGYTDYKVQGSDFGFLVGHNVGYIVPINNNMNLIMSHSLYHFSNAGTSKPNRGLNADVISTGLEIKF